MDHRYIQSTNRLALSVSEGLSHMRYTLWRISFLLHSSLIRFGTSLSNSCVWLLSNCREKEKKKKTCWNVDWPYSISNFALDLDLDFLFSILYFLVLVEGKTGAVASSTTQYKQEILNLAQLCVVFFILQMVLDGTTRTTSMFDWRNISQTKDMFRRKNLFDQLEGKNERENLPGKQHNVCVCCRQCCVVAAGERLKKGEKIREIIRKKSRRWNILWHSQCAAPRPGGLCVASNPPAK